MFFVFVLALGVVPFVVRDEVREIRKDVAQDDLELRDTKRTRRLYVILLAQLQCLTTHQATEAHPTRHRERDADRYRSWVGESPHGAPMESWPEQPFLQALPEIDSESRTHG